MSDEVKHVTYRQFEVRFDGRPILPALEELIAVIRQQKDIPLGEANLSVFYYPPKTFSSNDDKSSFRAVLQWGRDEKATVTTPSLRVVE